MERYRYTYIYYICMYIYNIYIYIYGIYMVYIYGGIHGIHHLKIEGLFEVAIKGYPEWN